MTAAPPLDDPRLGEAAAALQANELDRADALVEELLSARPDDAVALHLSAEIALRRGDTGRAQALLERSVAADPERPDGRFALAWLYHRENRPADAIPHVEQLLAAFPGEPNIARLAAALYDMAGRHAESGRLYGELSAAAPGDPALLLAHGHALRQAGHAGEAADAYRRALEIEPALGGAWWALANLKTGLLTDADVGTMRALVARGDIEPRRRAEIQFALGRALDERGQSEESFGHYAEANRLRREGLGYDPQEMTDYVDRARHLLTAGFFAERGEGGAEAPDPIFIVGMPRAGSTLVEQILASHSQVEGLGELPDLLAIARRLRERAEDRGSSYPQALADLDAAERTALGEEYLERTRARRRAGRPFFVDKMPNNWAHVGLIRLILPQARIVDVRRHPLGCCLSNFMQDFAEGQEFSYALGDLGHYYRDYARLMQHWQAALPGFVQRLSYESLVADTEAEIRRLLDRLGLDFEPACLDFHRTERAVATPSSEQVRRPIDGDAGEKWREYERFLDPLKEALGPALTAHRA